MLVAVYLIFLLRVVRIMTYCACINLKVVAERFPEISDQEESVAEPCCSMFFFCSDLNRCRPNPPFIPGCRGGGRLRHVSRTAGGAVC